MSDQDPLTEGGILLVDDDAAFRHGLARLLGAEGWRCLEAGDAAEARSALADHDDIVLVLCDVNLRGGSGIELLTQVRADHPDVAVMMVTGIDDPTLARVAFELGAHSYLTKPFETNEVLIAVHGALTHRRLERAHRAQLRALERTIARTQKVREVVLDVGAHPDSGSEEDTLERLSRAISLRDEETGRHIARVSRYAAVLAGHVGFDTVTSADLRAATALHDVGKIGVPDNVLLKPGLLGPEERAAMQQHPLIGYQLLAHGASALLRTAAEIALNHHEWWDGGGYPRGLAGDEIPEVARLATVADVFDALTSDRVYRPALSIEQALSIMDELGGRQFEPRLLAGMHEVLEEVLVIREELPDRDVESRIRVFVVDDHALVVQSLQALLETATDIKLVGTAETVRDAVAAAAAYDPDVVLMDFELPDGTGVEATKLIKAHRPDTRVVMLTGHADAEALLGAISAGCAGFLLKTEMADRVIAAVRAAYRGDEVTPAGELGAVLRELRPTNRGLGAALSARELQVLELLASGLAEPEIATALDLGAGAVRQHVESIQGKLRARSKLEAVATGVREGIIDRSLLVTTQEDWLSRRPSLRAR